MGRKNRFGITLIIVLVVGILVSVGFALFPSPGESTESQPVVSPSALPTNSPLPVPSEILKPTKEPTPTEPQTSPSSSSPSIGSSNTDQQKNVKEFAPERVAQWRLQGGTAGLYVRTEIDSNFILIEEDRVGIADKMLLVVENRLEFGGNTCGEVKLDDGTSSVFCLIYPPRLNGRPARLLSARGLAIEEVVELAKAVVAYE